MTAEPTAQFMKMALEEAEKNLVTRNGGPFGACIVSDSRVVALTRNTVLETHDPTCHAEINAVRMASRTLGTHNLSGCIIYSTTEPCPMCFSAIHWARLDQIVYGTDIEDLQGLGFNELTLGNEEMKHCGGGHVVLVKGFLREECLALLERWAQLPNRPTY
jgi:tRNA(Arg) A34 adenosine deaminase TadA